MVPQRLPVRWARRADPLAAWPSASSRGLHPGRAMQFRSLTARPPPSAWSLRRARRRYCGRPGRHQCAQGPLAGTPRVGDAVLYLTPPTARCSRGGPLPERPPYRLRPCSLPEHWRRQRPALPRPPPLRPPGRVAAFSWGSLRPSPPSSSRSWSSPVTRAGSAGCPRRTPRRSARQRPPERPTDLLRAASHHRRGNRLRALPPVEGPQFSARHWGRTDHRRARYDRRRPPRSSRQTSSAGHRHRQGFW